MLSNMVRRVPRRGRQGVSWFRARRSRSVRRAKWRGVMTSVQEHVALRKLCAPTLRDCQDIPKTVQVGFTDIQLTGGGAAKGVYGYPESTIPRLCRASRHARRRPAKPVNRVAAQG